MSKARQENTPERATLKVGEVAALLGISRRHVQTLTTTGKLPRPIRLGRSVRWLRADVLAHLDVLKSQAEGGA